MWVGPHHRLSWLPVSHTYHTVVGVGGGNHYYFWLKLGPQTMLLSLIIKTLLLFSYWLARPVSRTILLAASWQLPNSLADSRCLWHNYSVFYDIVLWWNVHNVCNNHKDLNQLPVETSFTVTFSPICGWQNKPKLPNLVYIFLCELPQYLTITFKSLMYYTHLPFSGFTNEWNHSDQMLYGSPPPRAFKNCR